MIARIQETTATGREKALFQICQVLSDESPNAQPSKDAALITLVLLAVASTTRPTQVASEAPEDHSSRRRVTAKSETSRTGKGKVLFRHPQQLHHHCGTEVGKLAEVLQETQPSDEVRQHGVKAQADRKMDLVPRDATSPRGKLWNEHLQLRNSTPNGGQTCGRTLQPNHLHPRRVPLVHQHHQQQWQHLPPGPNLT